MKRPCRVTINQSIINMVSLQHISKSFGSQKVLNDVSLEIPAGQIVGLLGPNGAGKSTLMKILIGLWSADSGTVSAPSRIGYLPENNPLYEDMYVSEYLAFMAKMTNDPYGEADRKNEVNKEMVNDQMVNISDPWYTGDFSKAFNDILEGCQALLNPL